MATTTRRTERLVNLVIALLEAPRPWTAEEIRERVAGYDEPPTHEAFRRMFERDKEELRGLGVPIEAVRTDPFSDQADGYVIPKDRYYLPDLDLEPDELAALRIAADVVLGMGDQAATGFLKLSADAPHGSWGSPRVVWGADVSAEVPRLEPLFTAVTRRIPIAFAYTSASGETSEREVEPYAIVHRRGHWYLVARDRTRDAIRSFKVTRIASDIEIRDGSFQVPEGVDVNRHVPAEAWEIGPDEEVRTATVRFDEPLRWWVEHNMPNAERAEGPGGALDVSVPVANADAFISWLIGFGPEVEIVAPADLRPRVREFLGPYLENGS